MSKLTAAQRRALPLAEFGEPSKRLYPIVDQADVDAAVHLIGKAADPAAVKARIIAIAQRKGLSLPDAWTEKAAMSALPVVLAGGASEEEQGMVRRTALITKPVDLPEHQWSITPEELKASADAFAGQGFVEIEHFQSRGKPSILDGHTGYVDGVWASEDGQELFGDLVLPSWLNDIADANGGKVSAVFNRDDKSFKGVGLVLDPAVPEAAMLSAYVTFAKRHDTRQGQFAMQELHDTACRNGATCSAGNVGMASKHEASAIQQAHDLAVEHGAKCDAMGNARGSMLFSKPPAGQEESPMGDQVQADTPTVAALQAQLDAEKAQREADRKALVMLQAERRIEKAEAFVDRLITENKAIPAERELLVKLHVQAATDDEMTGLVALSDGKTESRLATLVAALSARITIGLTKEQIAANPLVTVLLNKQQAAGSEPGKPTEEQKDNLLAMTPLGRKALDARRQRAAGAH